MAYHGKNPASVSFSVRGQIAKLAIVTNKSWMIFLVDLIKQIVVSEIKTFDNEQDASDWLMQD